MVNTDLLFVCSQLGELGQAAFKTPWFTVWCCLSISWQMDPALHCPLSITADTHHCPNSPHFRLECWGEVHVFLVGRFNRYHKHLLVEHQQFCCVPDLSMEPPVIQTARTSSHSWRSLQEIETKTCLCYTRFSGIWHYILTLHIWWINMGNTCLTLVKTLLFAALK